MFDHIAPVYDLLNHILSFNIDRRWRRKLVRLAFHDFLRSGKQASEASILDIATGTGDLAIQFSRKFNCPLTGIDISSGMLYYAKEKTARQKGCFTFIEADSENLPFTDQSFSLAAISFGVRNFSDIEKGLSEICRVLVPEGKLWILEFSNPQGTVFSKVYWFYSLRILPKLANLFTKDKRAYNYLPESIREFPSPHEFELLALNAGFRRFTTIGLSGGIASIFILEKKIDA